MAAEKYTKDFKVHACKLAKRIGARKAAKKLNEENDLNISDRQIRQWARQFDIDIVRNDERQKNVEQGYAQKVKNHYTREKMREKLLERTHEILDRMNQPHEQWLKGEGGELQLKTLPQPPSSAVRDYAVAAGILIDKLRLEAGEATSRSENISRNDKDKIDDELEALAQEIANKAAEENSLAEAKEKAGEYLDPALREPSKADL